MSLSPKEGVSDNEDNDSFHSFNDSETEFNANESEPSPSWKDSDSDSASDSESEHETSGTLEEEYMTDPLPPATKKTSIPKVSLGDHKPKSTVQPSDSSESSASDGVSTSNGTQPQMERFKFVVSPLHCREEPEPICPRKVPELLSKEVPNDDLFNLDSPQLRLKHYLASDAKTDAMQKSAFTEIWVDSQQNSSEFKRSPLRDFSVAMNAYFNQDLVKKKTDIGLVQPEAKPVKTIIPSVTSVKPAEEYVSPFEHMPVCAERPKETSLLDGAKKPIIVPAGFDLTRLVEFKNPNHWARRRHLRTGDRIILNRR